MVRDCSRSFAIEPRPKSGLLRVRQFVMKDSYSFDIDAAGLDVSYKKHYDAYCRIFDRCGLKYMVVEAHSGAMGGSESAWFMVRTPAGEDLIISCESCKYAANLGKGDVEARTSSRPGARRRREAVARAYAWQGCDCGCSEFRKISPRQDIKTVAYIAKKKLRRGRPTKRRSPFSYGETIPLTRRKLLTLIGANEFGPMQPEELEKYFHGPGGYIGPVGLQVPGHLFHGTRGRNRQRCGRDGSGAGRPAT